MRPWSSAAFVAVVVTTACATPRPATVPVAAAPSPAAADPPPVAPAPAPAPSPSAPDPPPPTPAAAGASAEFEATIKPILVSSCMPCHFPGGKMYDKLPFDDPDVVASHSEGVLRRIKAPEKREPLEAWLKTVDASAPR
jgi:hypothetical protein